ncbi:Nodulation protein O [Mucisphaera calidilacus]|uniref:Nodulation protein O n=1 Tax=Mucisphaera calidilacus TaxID=2527982 RepID=A0A518BVP0_9BACT|nr:Nodulation protein O [Mucisphaera calidilacus]
MIVKTTGEDLHSATIDSVRTLPGGHWQINWSYDDQSALPPDGYELELQSIGSNGPEAIPGHTYNLPYGINEFFIEQPPADAILIAITPTRGSDTGTTAISFAPDPATPLVVPSPQQLHLAEQPGDPTQLRVVFSSVRDADGYRLTIEEAGTLTQIREIHQSAEAYLSETLQLNNPNADITVTIYSKRGEDVTPTGRSANRLAPSTPAQFTENLFLETVSWTPVTGSDHLLFLNDGIRHQYLGTFTDSTNNYTLPDVSADNLQEIALVTHTPDSGPSHQATADIYVTSALGDSDTDGLTNGQEFTTYGTDPFQPDTDNDLLNDGDEVLTYATNPLDPDSDDDNLDDGLEVLVHSTNPKAQDTDSDGLSDGAEVLTHLSDPTSQHSDSDGISDGEEVLVHGTKPTNPDTDEDTLTDDREIFAELTNPLSSDTDGDGLDDAWEVKYKDVDDIDPINHYTDSDSNPDGDLLNTLQEYAVGTDPGVADEHHFWTKPSQSPDASLDADRDGILDIIEADLGTNPNTRDTDGDGLTDGFELQHGFDPNNPDEEGNQILDGQDDADDDTLNNSQEQSNGTNPSNPDTDGDGTNDNDEIANGSDPTDASDGGQPVPTAYRNSIRFTLHDSDSSGTHWDEAYGSRELIINDRIRLTVNHNDGIIEHQEYWYHADADEEIQLQFTHTWNHDPDLDYHYRYTNLPEGVSDRGWGSGWGWGWGGGWGWGRIYVSSNTPFWSDDPNYLLTTTVWPAGDWDWSYERIDSPPPDINWSGSATIHTGGLDLEITDLPNDQEDDPQQAPILPVSSADADNDDIPDALDINDTTRPLLPVELTLSSNYNAGWSSGIDPANTMITFRYQGPDQTEINNLASLTPTTLQSQGEPATTPGLRLWQDDASSPSLYLAPDTPISAQDLGLSPGNTVTLWIEASPGSNANQPYALAAEMNLTDTNQTNYTRLIADTVLARPLAVDLDIDSDNTALYDLPEGSESEDEIEASKPKVILVNRDDDDNDQIPDYADGYGAFSDNPSSVYNADEQFVPVTLKLPVVQDTQASLVFHYSADDPASVTRSSLNIEEIASYADPTAYAYSAAGQGLLRLWTKPGEYTRLADPISQGGDFVPAGTTISLDDLTIDAQGTVTLYLEAVYGSATPTNITVDYTVDSKTASDVIAVLPLAPDISISSDVQLEGYTLITGSGSITGTSGNDIIFGSDSADLIDAGSGDDIIIAGSGDDEIYSGNGSDIIYPGRGDDLIDVDNADTLPIASPEAENTIIYRDKIVVSYTNDNNLMLLGQALATYELLFGPDDPWLEAFAGIGGTIQARSETIWTFSDAYVDNVDGKPVLTLELENSDLDDPFKMATAMRQAILSYAGSSPVLFNGGYRKFQAYFTDNLQLFDLAKQRSYTDEQDEINTYQQLQQLGIAQAAEAAGLLATLYASGVTIISEAADLVFVLHDLATSESGEEQVIAMAGLLPFIPVGATGGVAKIILRSPVGELLVYTTGKVLYLPNTTAQLGIKLTRATLSEGAEKIRFVDDPTGISVPIFGRGHATGALNHDKATDRLAEQLAATGNYEYITTNLTWRTTLNDAAGNPLTDSPRRPDVIAVRRDGRVEAYEIPSELDDPTLLYNRMQEIMQTLPDERRTDPIIISITDILGTPE